jgi:hypothetical protein
MPKLARWDEVDITHESVRMRLPNINNWKMSVRKLNEFGVDFMPYDTIPNSYFLTSCAP